MKKLILSMALIGASSVAEAQAPARPAAAASAGDAAFGARMLGEASGEQIFTRVCAACHMQDAKGAEGAGRYPPLAGNQKLAIGAYPAMVVVKGLNGMPPIGTMLTDQQVADVVNYVRSHFGNKFKGAVKAEDVKAMR
ncbi:cytochrome c [Novosphingobium sp. SG707]|uniref:c-type cytochrome n=1 Tax=Novosphingobium sp. SG707 TaxID=2586996 RepID=UPI0018301616|nr:cytochrome c [Novosphingobium sp. SG707]NKJ00726.1 mono/diheme cytochrome c family protein [Novosphingobium sp. SG707]